MDGKTSDGVWAKLKRVIAGRGPKWGSAKDWSEHGRLKYEVRGEPAAGYETPGRLMETAEELGQAQGVVRADSDDALAVGNPADQYIDGATGVRKSVRAEATWKQIAPTYRHSKAAPGRARGEGARTQYLRNRLAELKRKAPAGAEGVNRAREGVAQARDELMGMPRLLRGYFTSPRPVALAGGAVVCFDAFVLHGALVTSGLDVVSIWGTTATVAIAVAAANHAFGVLAGALGLATPPKHRMRLAMVLFIAGFGAMLLAFGLLMVFRAEATGATNHALESIAKGKVPDHLAFFISPMWMGPLQVGGSLAAITLTAFWTMAKEGREHVALKIVPAEAALKVAVSEVQTVHAEILGLEDALEAAIVAKHEIEADGEGAAAVVATALMAQKGGDEGEDQLANAAKGRYRSYYAYHERLYRNGGVLRMATASVRGWLTRRWRYRGDANLPGSPSRAHPGTAPGSVRDGTVRWPWDTGEGRSHSNGHDPASKGGVQ